MQHIFHHQLIRKYTYFLNIEIINHFIFLACMANYISLLSFLLISTHFGVTISYTFTSICDQTPYPQLCNSLIPTTTAAATETTVNGSPYGLRDASLKETLARAQNIHKLVINMDVTSFSSRAKTAWADCVDLYDDSIYQLNRSTSSKSNELDVQTWLSATIANQQACQNGFLDFNMPSLAQSFPLMPLTDLSKFLSNSLAINKAISPPLYSQQNIINRRLLAHEFPEWVSNHDRKLLQSSGGSTKADIVVAKDGSGDYKTISEGLAAASSRRSGTKRFVIYVKKGIYKENVEVKRSMKNIMVIGDGIDATVVTGSKNVEDGSTTFRSATFAATGEGFIARSMTFENTAGAQKHQAVAFRSGSDFSVLYECSFKGYQDTLYVYSQRQFYRNCDIYGTIDFIFGDAVSVIQNCNIYLRQPMSNQKNTVTAQGRKDPNENTGIVIHNSRVARAPGAGSAKSYLGRPCQKYSRTVFIKCTIDGVIEAEGWLPWSGNFALSTLYYGEYINTGAGAATGGRVKWPGFHVITSAAEAGKFSVRSFLAGDSWLPATGVPFTSSI